MICATFVVALSNVLFKYFAVRSDYWSATFWTFVGEAIFGAGILAIPSYRRQFVMLLRTNTSALLSINGANELINLGGGLGVRFASLLAPVAVVSAISSTATLFVFAFGVLLSWFAPTIAREDLSKRNLARKGLSGRRRRNRRGSRFLTSEPSTVQFADVFHPSLPGDTEGDGASPIPVLARGGAILDGRPVPRKSTSLGLTSNASNN